MIIAVTGTPGTGKTTLSMMLSEKLGYQLLDLNDYIKNNPKLIIKRDNSRETNVINDNKLIEKISEEIKNKKIKNMVIDSHLSHYLSNKIIDKCIVLSCKIDVLKERLKQRGYNELKISENIEAETFDTILIEAQEAGHDIINLDSSRKIDIDEITKKLSL